jgi:DNA replication and repair protein RecF
MRFDSIRIVNLRCLEQIEFEPAPNINLICGPNGSGKTSVLEGFAIAGIGRSFLSNNAQDVIRNNAAGLSVNARVYDPGSGKSSTVMVRKLRGETQIELDMMPVLAASVLAQRLPLLVVNSKAADILTENPSNRRALVDRTMFHVEPQYVEHWKRYRLALRQRNELLRRSAPRRDAIYWEDSLDQAAEAIDQRRQAVLQAINARLAVLPLAQEFGGVLMHYSAGWNVERGLRQHLADNWERDQHTGFTTVGVHRADLTLKGAGKSLAKRLSRGQAKMLVIAIHVALAHFIYERTGHFPVFLVDDLHAELDDNMCKQAVDMILHPGGQALFTAIRVQDLPSALAETGQVFHVEQHRQKATA